MTATNIILNDFINMLVSIRDRNVKIIDLDMVPDPDSPNMNKLIIHIVDEGRRKFNTTPNVDIQNPSISGEDDIYSLFEGLI